MQYHLDTKSKKKFTFMMVIVVQWTTTPDYSQVS